MNCEKCQELLSDFLDDELTSFERAHVARHMEACAVCAHVREELELIVGAAIECRNDSHSPPDSRAMWLRISNVIEGERALTRPASAESAKASAAAREGFWTRLFSRRWELTLPQMAAAVSAVAVGAALATVLGVQSLWGDGGQPLQNGRQAGFASESANNSEEIYPNAYVRQQRARINYLEQRVQQRKANWNPRMRDSFDRSMSVIDRAVTDSLEELKRNPHDEVSESTLNSALRGKIELLREFSEQ